MDLRKKIRTSSYHEIKVPMGNLILLKIRMEMGGSDF